MFAQALIEDKFATIPTAEINGLAPKLSKLQTDLDALLTGENEANAVIDTLLPAVSDLQANLEGLTKKVEKDAREIREEHLEKLRDRLEDCRECAESTKSYVKENLDYTEDILDKIRKNPGPQPQR